jgi:hypothetical protein
MPSHDEFKLSITRALTSQLLEALEELEPDTLTPAAIAALEARPGIYQLYEDGELVYVGSAANSLPHRLGLHYRKLSGRQGVDMDDVDFTALYVDEDMTVLAPERQLIDAFREQGLCEWNTNGFGNKDPGRQRDTTAMPAGHFDVLHPINLDYVPGIDAGTWDLDNLLAELKRLLPFNFRYENTPSAREEFAEYETTVDADDLSARELFEAVAATLPDDWQITALPGYVVMYRESRTYPQADIIEAP